MRHIIIFLISLSALLPTTAMATLPTKFEADAAYAKQDYVKAAGLYEALLVSGANADLYYNLGNAYYRMQDYPHAILNYERALKYEPGHDDAAYNLEVARLKCGVFASQGSEMFFVTWLDEFVCSQSADGWGLSALVFFALMLAFFVTYRLAARMWLRKSAFTLSVLSLFVVVFCITAAVVQNNRFHNEHKAVLMAETELTTDGAKTKKHILPAGTTVIILDASTDSILLVETRDQLVHGWVKGRNLTRF